MEFGRLSENGSEEIESAWIRRQNSINEYLQPALGLYFEKQGTDPFAKSV